MNEYSKELCHWAIGKRAPHHKYVAREKGKTQGTYRYFYDMAEWKAFKDGVKKKVDNAAKEVSKTANKVSRTVKQQSKATVDELIKTRANKIKYESAAKSVQNVSKAKNPKEFIKKLKDIAVTTINKIVNSKPMKAVAKLIKALSEIKIEEKVTYTVLTVSDNVKDLVNKRKNNKDGEDEEPSGYIAKVKLSNGEYAYFYTEDDYWNWYNRNKYQKNEPEFMKDVPEITPDSSGHMPTIAEDSSAINSDYFDIPGASTNCWHCSTAYDLRKRGYDISAAKTSSDYNEKDLGTFYDIDVTIDTNTEKANDKFEKEANKAVTQYLMDTGQHYATGKIEQALSKVLDSGTIVTYAYATDNKGSVKSVSPVKAVADYVKKSSGSTFDKDAKNKIEKAVNNSSTYGEAVANAINDEMKSYPNNSWGRLGLHWETGGAHSIAWEKDSKGNVKYIDTQVNIEVDISKYAASTNKETAVVISRTDNLKLKEEVLDYIIPHEKQNEIEFNDPLIKEAAEAINTKK